jgi:hypothetical protein
LVFLFAVAGVSAVKYSSGPSAPSPNPGQETSSKDDGKRDKLSNPPKGENRSPTTPLRTLEANLKAALRKNKLENSARFRPIRSEGNELVVEGVVVQSSDKPTVENVVRQALDSGKKESTGAIQCDLKDPKEVVQAALTTKADPKHIASLQLIAVVLKPSTDSRGWILSLRGTVNTATAHRQIRTLAKEALESEGFRPIDHDEDDELLVKP